MAAPTPVTARPTELAPPPQPTTQPSAPPPLSSLASSPSVTISIASATGASGSPSLPPSMTPSVAAVVSAVLSSPRHATLPAATPVLSGPLPPPLSSSGSAATVTVTAASGGPASGEAAAKSDAASSPAVTVAVSVPPPVADAPDRAAAERWAGIVAQARRPHAPHEFAPRHDPARHWASIVSQASGRLATAADAPETIVNGRVFTPAVRHTPVAPEAPDVPAAPARSNWEAIVLQAGQPHALHAFGPRHVLESIRNPAAHWAGIEAQARGVPYNDDLAAVVNGRDHAPAVRHPPVLGVALPPPPADLGARLAVLGRVLNETLAPRDAARAQYRASADVARERSCWDPFVNFLAFYCYDKPWKALNSVPGIGPFLSFLYDVIVHVIQYALIVLSFGILFPLFYKVNAALAKAPAQQALDHADALVARQDNRLAAYATVVAAMKTRFDALQARYNALSDDHDALNDHYGELETELDELEAEFAHTRTAYGLTIERNRSLVAQLNEIGPCHDELHDAVDANEATIALQKGAVESLLRRVNELTGRVRELEAAPDADEVGDGGAHPHSSLSLRLDASPNVLHRRTATTVAALTSPLALSRSVATASPTARSVPANGASVSPSLTPPPPPPPPSSPQPSKPPASAPLLSAQQHDRASVVPPPPTGTGSATQLKAGVLDATGWAPPPPPPVLSATSTAPSRLPPPPPPPPPSRSGTATVTTAPARALPPLPALPTSTAKSGTASALSGQPPLPSLPPLPPGPPPPSAFVPAPVLLVQTDPTRTVPLTLLPPPLPSLPPLALLTPSTGGAVPPPLPVGFGQSSAATSSSVARTEPVAAAVSVSVGTRPDAVADTHALPPPLSRVPTVAALNGAHSHDSPAAAPASSSKHSDAVATAVTSAPSVSVGVDRVVKPVATGTAPNGSAGGARAPSPPLLSLSLAPSLASTAAASTASTTGAVDDGVLSLAAFLGAPSDSSAEQPDLLSGATTVAAALPPTLLTVAQLKASAPHSVVDKA